MSLILDTTISKRCVSCKKMHEILVNSGDYHRWLRGDLIQDAMPYLTLDERELLISGWCGVCFNKLMSVEE